MLYVPEDDLPASFHSSSSLALSTGSASLASLAKEYAVKRMVGPGFSRRDAEEAYDTCGCVETEAVAMLCRGLYSCQTHHCNISSENNDGASEVVADWKEEMLSLESTFGPEVGLLILFSDCDPPSYLKNQLRSVSSMMQRTPFP
jgi:hypothetical protein